ncbi:hypothetical protein GJAV_G00147690 [Gymnothorax javanicus]|nr:hypothetical protein GJAV_G00147690 [Gymnothorax javanicus]
MKFMLRSQGIILTAVFCLLLNNAQVGDSVYVPIRCVCPQSNAFVPENLIADFSITEKGAHCDSDEIIVTMKKTNLKVCLNAKEKQGKHLISCWNRIHRDENKKLSCLRKRKPHN